MEMSGAKPLKENSKLRASKYEFEFENPMRRAAERADSERDMRDMEQQYFSNGSPSGPTRLLAQRSYAPASRPGGIIMGIIFTAASALDHCIISTPIMQNDRALPAGCG